MPKTCCFSGYRKLNEKQKELAVIGLVGFIGLAIEQDYTHFISGFAEGVDLIAANIVIKEKMQNKNLSLEAAIPHKGRLQSKDDYFQELLQKCDKKTIIQDEYSKECFFKRNRYMVDNSDLLIAVWNGLQKGGTYYTIEYAKKQGKKTLIIPVKE